MSPEQMADLQATVLTRYAADLAAAPDGEPFEHLARRAEALYSTDLGVRERALVDTERARRAARVGGAR